MDPVKIGKGGFSSVYAAKHKVDQQLYAIKKTVLKVPVECTANVHDEMHRMLQEVRLFAAISNPHIIRYNHSWIEVTEGSTDYAVENISSQQPELPNDELSVELESPYIEFAGFSNSGSKGSPKEEVNSDQQEGNGRKQSNEQGPSESR